MVFWRNCCYVFVRECKLDGGGGGLQEVNEKTEKQFCENRKK